MLITYNNMLGKVIFASINADHSTAFLVLDLFAAFNTFDRRILTYRLQHYSEVFHLYTRSLFII